MVTPRQRFLVMAAFDMQTSHRADLRELLHAWTHAAARMTRGEVMAKSVASRKTPPADTGEAMGLSPANFTLTFGFGRSLFDDRFGLKGHRPRALRSLPSFSEDRLDPTRSGGDLLVQACADDGQVAFHAMRDLVRRGLGVASVRWMQDGFMPDAPAGATARNLQGFKDGTNNLHGDDARAMHRFVWVGRQGDPKWMRNGTYMVVRRIRMRIELWDRSSLEDQERTIGRDKHRGAPLGAAHEHDAIPLHATTQKGKPVIPEGAHIRLANPATNGGEAILRRPYNFADGIDPVTGQLDAGLFFVCFQRDPFRQFVRIQARLDKHDELNEYIQHVGSGLFAVPPGATPGGYVGQGLLEG